MTPITRPLNKDDIESFGGLPASVRGVTLEVDGEPIGIAGLLYTNPLQAFSLMKPEAKKYPKAIIKTARQLATILNSVDAPVFAVADKQYNTSEKFLKHIGFEHLRGRLYQWGRNS